MTDIRVAAEQARVAFLHAQPRSFLPADWEKHRTALASLEAALAALPGDKPLTWKFVGIAGLKPYLTDAQYAAQTPGTRRFYEPVCRTCHPAATPAVEVPQIAGRDGASDEIQEASCSSDRAPCRAASSPLPSLSQTDDSALPRGCVKPDTDKQVFFYEQDFYVLSNFSAFRVTFDGQTFDTSEAAYHYQRFTTAEDRRAILYAYSAHDAFRYAQDHKANQRPDWDSVKVDVMRAILRAKVDQHEYVRRKLLASGDRELIEDSWRDAYWGWGPNRDGQNVLGKLWMEVRSELRQVAHSSQAQGELSVKEQT